MVLLAFASFATEPPKIVESGEVPGTGGGKAFTLTTRTEDGITIRAVAEPKSLKFTLTGALPFENHIPLVYVPETDPNQPAALTPEQKKAKEATERLLAASGSFASPRDLELKHKPEYVDTVWVRFMFLGDENPARKVKLTIVLQDEQGRVLKELSRSCADQRIAAKEASDIRISGRRIVVTSLNHEHFKVDKPILDNVRQVEVSLEVE